MSTEPLDRPAFSNGFEWDHWSANWCHRCLNDANEDCPLILTALMGQTPREWVQVEPMSLQDRYVCSDFRPSAVAAKNHRQVQRLLLRPSTSRSPTHEAHRCCYRCPVPAGCPLHGDVVSDGALAVGARVCYWPGWHEGDPRRGVLDSERTLLGGHTWGYYVRKDGGGSDFIAETHIEADDATPPLVAASPVPPVVPDSEALDLGRCFCRHLELTCTGPDGHPNRHAAWNGRGNLIAWACYCHSSKSPHMDPEAGIANV